MPSLTRTCWLEPSIGPLRVSDFFGEQFSTRVQSVRAIRNNGAAPAESDTPSEQEAEDPAPFAGSGQPTFAPPVEAAETGGAA